MKNVESRWTGASRPQVGTGRQSQICYTLWSSELQPAHTTSHQGGGFWSQPSSSCHHPSPGLHHLGRDHSWASSQSPLFHCGSTPTLHMSKGAPPNTPQQCHSLSTQTHGICSNYTPLHLPTAAMKPLVSPGYPVASHQGPLLLTPPPPPRLP